MGTLFSFTCRLIWKHGGEWNLTISCQFRGCIVLKGAGVYTCSYTSWDEVCEKFPAVGRIANGLGPQWLKAIGNGGKVVWFQDNPDWVALNGRKWALQRQPTEPAPTQRGLWT